MFDSRQEKIQGFIVLRFLVNLVTESVELSGLVGILSCFVFLRIIE